MFFFQKKWLEVFVLWGLIILTFSCSIKDTDDQEKPLQTTSSYVNIDKVIDSLASLYRSNHYQLKKTLTLQDNTEIKVIESVNWENELSPIKAASIHKTAWKDKFKIDTVFLDGKQISSIEYTCQNNQIPIRSLKVKYKNNSPYKYEIERKNDNMLFKSQQDITFDIEKGYTVSGYQKAMILSKHNYKVIGELIKPNNE